MHTKVDNTQVTTNDILVRVPKLVRRGGCHTHMGNMTETDIHTWAISYLPHHHHHIHHTHYIHQLLSEIKQDKHAIERQ